MNILYLLPYLEGGGTERHVLSLCKGLKERGHGIRVLAPRGELASEFERAGIPLTFYKSLGESPFSGARDLVQNLKYIYTHDNPDVIHVHAGTELLIVNWWVMRSIPALKRPSVIFTVHTYFSKTSSFDYFLAARCGNRLAKSVITVSHDDGERMVSSGLYKDKLRVILNGVPSPPSLNDSEKKKFRGEWNILDNAVLLSSVGRLEEQKGYDLLIPAFASACKSHNELYLIVFGEGSQRDRLESLSTKLNINHRLRLPGFISDAPTKIQATDIFISSSRLEGLSLALVEAMAAGLPIIATDAGGNREAVGLNYPYVIPIEDEFKLAESIDKLVSDSNAIKELGMTLKERFNREFTEDAMVEKTLQVYSE